MIVASGLGDSQPAPACAWYQDRVTGGCGITPLSLLRAPTALAEMYLPSVYGPAVAKYPIVEPLVMGGAWLLVLGLVFAGGHRGRR